MYTFTVFGDVGVRNQYKCIGVSPSNWDQLTDSHWSNIMKLVGYVESVFEASVDRNVWQHIHLQQEMLSTSRLCQLPNLVFQSQLTVLNISMVCRIYLANMYFYKHMIVMTISHSALQLYYWRGLIPTQQLQTMLLPIFVVTQLTVLQFPCVLVTYCGSIQVPEYHTASHCGKINLMRLCAY